MNKVILLVLYLFLTGCAAPGAPIDDMLKQGDFVSAYKYAIVRGEKQKQRTEFVSNLKSDLKGYPNDKFYQAANSYISEIYKSESNFIELAKLITMSASDGLINQQQAKALTTDLIYFIETESLTNPDILKSHALTTLVPEINSPESKIGALKRKLTLINQKENSKLKDIIPLIEISASINNPDLTNQIIDIGSKLAASELDQILASKAEIKLTYSNISPYLIFANFYNNDPLSQKIKYILPKVNFSKKDLSSIEMEKFDSNFAKKEIELRTKRIKLVIDPDDGALHEDLMRNIINLNEWVEFNEESKTILTIKRQRFLESLGSPSVGTEIVSDPNFGTLLFIPRNASVLFDHITTEYRIDYSIEASLSGTSKRKVIRGTDGAKKIDCRNIRYQNVFGGVGSIDWFPNDRVQNFCTSSSNASFDVLKNKVLEKISNEINLYILLD